MQNAHFEVTMLTDKNKLLPHKIALMFVHFAARKNKRKDDKRFISFSKFNLHYGFVN